MKNFSVNAGLPRTVSYQDRAIETAICKSPVAGTVRARALNLDGDRQADLTVGDISRLYAFDKIAFGAMGSATGGKLVPESWKEYFRRRLSQPSTR